MALEETKKAQAQYPIILSRTNNSGDDLKVFVLAPGMVVQKEVRRPRLSVYSPQSKDADNRLINQAQKTSTTFRRRLNSSLASTTRSRCPVFFAKDLGIDGPMEQRTNL